jgi:CubicO group peptidase (beta-lactamase class C family)
MTRSTSVSGAARTPQNNFTSQITSSYEPNDSRGPIMLRSISLCLFWLLVLTAARGQSLDPLLQKIDEYAAKVQADWQVPGMAIAIVRDGQTVFAKGYGVRRLGESESVDADTLFAIASNSKAFTTASLAILVDEGKLNWDDPMRKYLPEFEMDARS